MLNNHKQLRASIKPRKRVGGDQNAYIYQRPGLVRFITSTIICQHQSSYQYPSACGTATHCTLYQCTPPLDPDHSQKVATEGIDFPFSDNGYYKFNMLKVITTTIRYFGFACFVAYR